MNIKVSVIVPAYNLQDYIADCLKGLLNQETDFDYEVICVDDYSTDSTWQVIRALSNRYPHLKVFRNNKNLGLARTQKRLLELARGGRIAYLDGDDVALPGKLQALENYMDVNPDCVLAYHEAEIFDSATGNILGYYSRDFYNVSAIPGKANVEYLIQYGCFINASSFMFRRHEKLLDAIDEQCRIILDYPWHILNALYLGGSIDFVEGVYGRYRMHDNSFGGQTRGSSQRRVQCLLDQIRAVENARRFGVSERIIEKGKAHHYFATALNFLKQGREDLFVEYIELASEKKVFFDERHKLAYQHRLEPAYVKKQLFGALTSAFANA